jgi:hypothetical protein
VSGYRQLRLLSADFVAEVGDLQGVGSRGECDAAMLIAARPDGSSGCDAGHWTTGTISTDHAMRYIAPVPVCRACSLKSKCCPNMPARRIVRDINEDARDVARALAKTEAFEQSCRERKRVEMLFAHLKRILRLGRLRLRGPRGAQFEFTLAAIAQNLRRLGKLVARPPPQAATCAA